MLPAVIAGAGERAERRFIEFFTANIRNPNTRAAYARAAGDFVAWLEERHVTLDRVEPVMVAAYIERLGRTKSPPTVKQSLAAIRMLFDWMVIGQVFPMNPASSVRGPKHVVKRGKTPVLTADQARHLFDSRSWRTEAPSKGRSRLRHTSRRAPRSFMTGQTMN